MVDVMVDVVVDNMEENTETDMQESHMGVMLVVSYD